MKFSDYDQNPDRLRTKYNPNTDRYEEDGEETSPNATAVVTVGVLIAIACLIGYGVFKLINYGIIKL
jgi:hypothetical protein